MYKRTMLGAATLAALLVCAGCAMQPTPPMQGQTLYQRLGGKDAVAAVVDDAVGNIAADARINGRFAHTDIPRLKKNLAEQVCAGTGGPCTYTGRNMADAHDGLNIRDDEFDALVEDLVRSLDKFKVPAREKSELLAILGQMRNVVVGH